jgi:hypothetical protein
MADTTAALLPIYLLLHELYHVHRRQNLRAAIHIASGTRVKGTLLRRSFLSRGNDPLLYVKYDI